MPPSKRKASIAPTSSSHRAKRNADRVPSHAEGMTRDLVQPAPPTLLDILDVDRHYPVYDQLCSYMPIASVLALSGACKQLRRAFQQRYSVDNRLLRYVKYPLRLRSELGRHGALIAGGFALQLFAQRKWAEFDLDVFVQKGAAAEAFCTYLQKEENYCLEHAITYSSNDYVPAAQCEIRTFRRPESVDPKLSEVLVFVTPEEPIRAILYDSDMTALMNVISWNKAYSIFAKDTLVDFKSYTLRQMSSYFEQLLQQYAGRGWTVEEIMRPEDYSPTSGIRAVRRLGDRFTWSIPLSTEGVEQAKQPDFVLEYSQFTLTPVKLNRRPVLSYYVVSTDSFRHIALNHCFVTGHHEAWQRYLSERLHSYAKLGLLAMTPEERPRWFVSDQNQARQPSDELPFSDEHHIRMFQKPKHWKTFDDEIPRWYDQWYNKVASRECLNFPDEIIEI